MYTVNTSNIKINPILCKGVDGFDQSLQDDSLFNYTGETAITIAKSILSTEIMKILQPMASINVSPYDTCNKIMSNINLDGLARHSYDNTLMNSLLYNEFYKVSIEISVHGEDVDTDILDKVMNKLNPTIQTIVVLLNNSKK